MFVLISKKENLWSRLHCPISTTNKLISDLQEDQQESDGWIQVETIKESVDRLEGSSLRRWLIIRR